MSRQALVENRTASDAESRDSPAFAFHAVRSLLLRLADLDHEHRGKLERLRLSRMPAVWQTEIEEQLQQEHEEKRATCVQRLRELGELLPARLRML
jgi:hypothetical protein